MGLFFPGLTQATDTNGNPLSGAKWRFFLTETTTPENVFSTADMSTSLGAVVTADAAGRFVPIYLDDSITYRARLETATGTVIDRLDIDPVDGASCIGFQRTGADKIDLCQIAAAGAWVAAEKGVTGDGSFADTARMNDLLAFVAEEGGAVIPPRRATWNDTIEIDHQKVALVCEPGTIWRSSNPCNMLHIKGKQVPTPIGVETPFQRGKMAGGYGIHNLTLHGGGVGGSEGDLDRYGYHGVYFGGEVPWAEGWLQLDAQPTAGQTFTLKSQVYTFIAGPPTTWTQVPIGATIDATMRYMLRSIQHDRRLRAEPHRMIGGRIKLFARDRSGTSGQHAIATTSGAISLSGPALVSTGTGDLISAANEVALHNLTILGCDLGIRNGNNAYIPRFFNPNIGQCNTTIDWIAGFGTENSGENITIHGGVLHSSRNMVRCGGSYVGLHGTSVDYHQALGLYAHSGGIIKHIGGHNENTDDPLPATLAEFDNQFNCRDYWCLAEDSGSQITQRDVWRVQMDERVHGSLYHTDGNGSAIEIHDSPLNFSVRETASIPRFQGTGQVRITGLSHHFWPDGNGAAQPDVVVHRNIAPTAAQNLFAYPNFAYGAAPSGNLGRADWTVRHGLSSDGTITYAGYSGMTYDAADRPAWWPVGRSLVLTPPVGRRTRMVHLVSACAGARVNMAFDIKRASVSLSGTAELTLQYHCVSPTGGILTSGPIMTFNAATTPADWKRRLLRTDMVAPGGTALIMLVVEARGDGVDAWKIADLKEWLSSGECAGTPMLCHQSFRPFITGSITAGAATYALQSGLFSVSGNRASCAIRIEWTGHTGSGLLHLEGLPFQADYTASITSAEMSRFATAQGRRTVMSMSGGANRLAISEVNEADEIYTVTGVNYTRPAGSLGYVGAPWQNPADPLQPVQPATPFPAAGLISLNFEYDVS